MVTIYTTATCPKCKILKKKMDAKGIEYEECRDEEKMRDLGIMSVPVLSVDGKLLDFSEAYKYIDER